ncbi:MAG: hypothetical protein NVS9B2_23350 [Steroidobacteraceae bacterium]
MATPVMLETSRAHTATGAFGNTGGTITAITNATPIVVTTTTAHGLIDGDQVQISGVTTETAANGTFFVKRTSYTTTTFALYTDSALTVATVGNGVAGGLATATLSQALDISTVTNDWTLKFQVEYLTSAKKIVVSLQDSVDGFVADIVTRWSETITGLVNQGPNATTPQTTSYTSTSKTYSRRKYDLNGMRFGTANARLRLYVQSIDAASTAVLSAWYES